MKKLASATLIAALSTTLFMSTLPTEFVGISGQGITAKASEDYVFNLNDLTEDELQIYEVSKQAFEATKGTKKIRVDGIEIASKNALSRYMQYLIIKGQHDKFNVFFYDYLRTDKFTDIINVDRMYTTIFEFNTALNDINSQPLFYEIIELDDKKWYRESSYNLDSIGQIQYEIERTTYTLADKYASDAAALSLMLPKMQKKFDAHVSKLKSIEKKTERIAYLDKIVRSIGYREASYFDDSNIRDILYFGKANTETQVTNYIYMLMKYSGMNGTWNGKNNFYVLYGTFSYYPNYTYISTSLSGKTYYLLPEVAWLSKKEDKLDIPERFSMLNQSSFNYLDGYGGNIAANKLNYYSANGRLVYPKDLESKIYSKGLAQLKKNKSNKVTGYFMLKEKEGYSNIELSAMGKRIKKKLKINSVKIEQGQEHLYFKVTYKRVK